MIRTRQKLITLRCPWCYRRRRSDVDVTGHPYLWHCLCPICNKRGWHTVKVLVVPAEIQLT